MGWLLSLFIAATVFGVGVTTIDFFGLIGDHEVADDDGDFADAEGDASDADSSSDAGRGSVAGHDRRHRSNPVLQILSALRNLVYFSLGFGPTGWFALGTGRSLTSALLWSGGVGVVVLAGARLMRRILRTELNSEVHEVDLLMEKGEVTVTVNPNELGRVRVSIGGIYVDRYARSQSNKALIPGTVVRVVDLGEDCVIIESEEE